MINKIYPNIEFKSASVVEGDDINKHFRLFTKIRKQSADGKWYLMNIMKHGVNMKYEDMFHQFIKEVYNYQILGIVSTDITDLYGNSICELDSDQRSEEERLKSFLI